MVVTLNKRVLDPKATLSLLDDLALELVCVGHVTEGNVVADDLALDAARVRLGMLALDRAKDSDTAEGDVDSLFAHGMLEPGVDYNLAGDRVSAKDVSRVLDATWQQLCAFNGVDEYVASKLRTFIVELRAERLHDGNIAFDGPQDGELLRTPTSNGPRQGQ